jgi:D-alanine--poly(phosphoribitol) ligase subunit 2
MDTKYIIASVLNEIIASKGLSVSGYGEKIFESGIIDSYGIVELLLALENEFQIKIPYEDMTVQNFASINDISLLIERQK